MLPSLRLPISKYLKIYYFHSAYLYRLIEIKPINTIHAHMVDEGLARSLWDIKLTSCQQQKEARTLCQDFDQDGNATGTTLSFRLRPCLLLLVSTLLLLLLPRLLAESSMSPSPSPVSVALPLPAAFAKIRAAMVATNRHRHRHTPTHPTWTYFRFRLAFWIQLTVCGQNGLPKGFNWDGVAGFGLCSQKPLHKLWAAPPDNRDKLSNRHRRSEPKMQSAAFPHAFLPIILCLSVKKTTPSPRHTHPSHPCARTRCQKAPTHMVFVLS